MKARPESRSSLPQILLCFSSVVYVKITNRQTQTNKEELACRCADKIKRRGKVSKQLLSFYFVSGTVLTGPEAKVLAKKTR